MQIYGEDKKMNQIGDVIRRLQAADSGEQSV